MRPILTYNQVYTHRNKHPDSKVHGANMGPTWGRQDPGGPHVGPMDRAIWDIGAILKRTYIVL